MKPKGIRFSEPTLRRLEAIRIEEGYTSIGQTVRELLSEAMEVRRNRKPEAA